VLNPDRIDWIFREQSHIGVVCEDIEVTIAEYELLGYTFVLRSGTLTPRRPGMGPQDPFAARSAWSLQGPSACRAGRGSPTVARSPICGPPRGHDHVEHVGYYVDDLAAASALLQERGFPAGDDGRRAMTRAARWGSATTRTPSGARIELEDGPMRKRMLAEQFARVRSGEPRRARVPAVRRSDPGASANDRARAGDRMNDAPENRGAPRARPTDRGGDWPPAFTTSTPSSVTRPPPAPAAASAAARRPVARERRAPPCSLGGAGPDGLVVLRYRPSLWSTALECYPRRALPVAPGAAGTWARAARADGGRASRMPVHRARSASSWARARTTASPRGERSTRASASPTASRLGAGPLNFFLRARAMSDSRSEGAPRPPSRAAEDASSRGSRRAP